MYSIIIFTSESLFISGLLPAVCDASFLLFHFRFLLLQPHVRVHPTVWHQLIVPAVKRINIKRSRLFYSQSFATLSKINTRGAPPFTNGPFTQKFYAAIPAAFVWRYFVRLYAVVATGANTVKQSMCLVTLARIIADILHRNASSFKGTAISRTRFQFSGKSCLKRLKIKQKAPV